MGKILGGFKNMLKRWRINLKNKKKKEQIEQDEIKNKRDSKFQSLLYSFIAILYAPIGYLFARNKVIEKKDENQKSKENKIEEIIVETPKNQKYVNIKSKINQSNYKVNPSNKNVINNKIGSTNSNTKESYLKNENKELVENKSKSKVDDVNFEKNGYQPSSVKQNSNRQSGINSLPSFNKLFSENLEIKSDEIITEEKDNNVSLEKDKLQQVSNVQNFIKPVKSNDVKDIEKISYDEVSTKQSYHGYEQSYLEELSEDLNDNLDYPNEEYEINNIEESVIKIENFENVVIEDVKVSTEEDKKNNLDELNKEAKEILLQVEYFDKQINVVSKYNDLYYVQNELNYLYEQIHLLREKYKTLDVQTEELYNFDEFELHKDDMKLEELEKYIEDTFKKVNQRKDEIFIIKEQKQKEELKVVEEKKKEKVIEEKQKKEEKKEKEFNEFEIANKIVLQDIMNQQNYLEKNLRKIKSRVSILGYMSSFFKKMIGLNLILLPFGLIKNPLLFGLVNSILVNNSLKTMRKLNNPKLNPNYEFLLDNYLDSKQIMLRTFQNYVDSLNELDNLETEIMNLNPNMELLKDIQVVRNNIEKQIEKIKEKNEIIDKVYVKLKEE